MSRPVEAVTLVRTILDNLPRVEEEIALFTPVIQPVIGQIVGISRFSSPNYLSFTGLDRDFISKQHALILFLEEQWLYMQPISLAREWMIILLLVAARAGAQ